MPVLFFTDEQTRDVINPSTGEMESRTVKLARPVLVVSMAYNIHEVNGIEAQIPESPKNLGWETADLLDHLKDVTQAKIIHGNRPAYTPKLDAITMPAPQSFEDEGEYAKTLLHEIAHWTGNDKRLNRDLTNPSGSVLYAREELVAEITSMITCQQAGLPFNPATGEAYVKDWWGAAKELLQDNPNEIMKIAKDAYAARDYIVEGKELDRLKQESVEHKVELSEDEKQSGRISLNIPYREKDEAKAIARAIGVELEWDKASKGWFAKVEDGQNIGNLAKFRTTDDYVQEAKGELEKEVTKENHIQAIMDIPYPIKDFAKDEAKALGVELKFDRKNKNWKATGEKNALEKLQTFIDAQQKNREKNPVEAVKSEPASDKDLDEAELKKVFLDVPFKDKDRAKSLAKEAGIALRFDREARAWYCDHPGELPASLAEFKVASFTVTPRIEVQTLSDKLYEMGAQGDAGAPVFDGKFHRLAVVGDKAGEKSLSYKAYDNGVPNAVIVNHKTGEKEKWLGTAPKLTDKERKEIELTNANSAEKARWEAAATIKAASNEAKRLLDSSPSASSDHPYLAKKGIQPHGLKQDEKGNLLVPITNCRDEIRSYQRITPNGEKRFAKGAEKMGNFAKFGTLKNSNPIIIAEGVATAATIAETSGVSTVAALDCHNLKHVAQQVRKFYPLAPIIIAADNDHTKEKNIGLEKAEAAAEAVGGRVLIPKFNKDTEAELTDYNDLARVHGKEAVVRDVSAAVRQRAASKESEKPNKSKEGKSNER